MNLKAWGVLNMAVGALGYPMAFLGISGEHVLLGGAIYLVASLLCGLGVVLYTVDRIVNGTREELAHAG